MATTELLEKQEDQLRAVHPSAAVAAAGDGTHIVSLDLPVDPGWNLRGTTVEFVLPVAYPSAQPDCFYTSAQLRLGSGSMPGKHGDAAAGWA